MPHKNRELDFSDFSTIVTIETHGFDFKIQISPNYIACNILRLCRTFSKLFQPFPLTKKANFQIFEHSPFDRQHWTCFVS